MSRLPSRAVPLAPLGGIRIRLRDLNGCAHNLAAHVTAVCVIAPGKRDDAAKALIVVAAERGQKSPLLFSGPIGFRDHQLRIGFDKLHIIAGFPGDAAGAVASKASPVGNMAKAGNRSAAIAPIAGHSVFQDCLHRANVAG